MMKSKIYIAAYNPESKYEDKINCVYNYRADLPNAKQIKKGDLLIFYNTKKSSRDYGIFSFAIIHKIIDTVYSGKHHKSAIYNQHVELTLMSLKSNTGEDYRENIQHSMSRVKPTLETELLFNILNSIKND